MNATDPYRRRLLISLLTVGIVALAIYIAGVRSIPPGALLIGTLMLTAFAIVAGAALEIVFPKATRRRKVVQRGMLVLSAVLIVLQVASGLPIRWATGRPGRSIELDFRYGKLLLEIDYANATEHDKLHGVAGYWRIFVPIGLSLLFLLPLTLIMWFDVIERKIPWLKSRYPPGHCQTCGYNLTGNVSGVCPECGSRISKEIP